MKRKMNFIESTTRMMNRHGIYDCFDIARDLSHKKTGNIWIECFSKENTIDFVESGININTECYFLYVVGDYDKMFVLSKKHLKTMAKKQELRFSKDGKHKGFLLSIKEANHLSIMTFSNEFVTLGQTI